MNHPIATSARPCEGLVVLVEDEQDTRELLQELLESRGYRVATASDGCEALELFHSIPSVCLVILDLLMPRMDGFDLLAAIAEDPKLSHLRVCISTSAPERAPHGLPCLPKPINVERMFSVLAEHCLQAN